MRFWTQLPTATKIYLTILVCLFILLFGLAIVRDATSGSEAYPFWMQILNKRNVQETLATPANPMILPTLTFPPDIALLQTMDTKKVYEGPGEQFAVIALLENEQVVRIVGVSLDKQWWAIDLPYFASGRGWISAKNVKVENTANVQVLMQETLETSTPENPAMVLAIANVNIRSGPDIKYMKIGNLQNGQSAEIIGVSSDKYWWLIRVPKSKNVQGWISRDYVVARNVGEVPVIGSQPGVEQTVSPGAPYLVAVMNVNVRAGPDITFAVIGQLIQDQLAEVVGGTRDRLWWAIKFPNAENGRGWVAAAYVKAENVENVPILK